MKPFRFLFTLISLAITFGVLPALPVQAESPDKPLHVGGDFRWAKSMSGANDDEGRGVAVDTSGNVYTTGYFQGTVDFNPGVGTANLTSAGQNDIFISKLDSNGDFAWARSIGGASSETGYGIAADSSGSIYVTGSFSGTVDFDPGAGTANLISAGPTDIFVSKLDGNGNLLWAKSMGGMSLDESYGMTIDSGGNVYTVGAFSGTADFDPGTGTANLTSVGPSDIFVSKLDNNGGFIWAKSMGGADSENGLGIAVDSSGNIYTTGWFLLTADFDPGVGTVNLTSAGNNDIFVSKLDSSGNFVWAKSMGGPSSDAGFSIALDSSDNVYTTGPFSGTSDFYPGDIIFNLTSGGQNDSFVSKLDSSGNFLWAKSMVGMSPDAGLGIALDSRDNVYTTGYFSDTVDFNPGTGIFNLNSAGSLDIFVSKLNSNGNFIWAKGMGGIDTDKAHGIALDSNNNLYMTGSFAGTVDFDPGASTFNLVSVGSTDIFISKLEGDGPCPSAIMVANNHDAGSGSLRQAITDVCPKGTITFDASLSGEAIYLASTLAIDKSLTITGSGLASQIQISGDTDNNGTGNVQVFRVAGVTATLNSLVITRGLASNTRSGGGIENYGTLTVTNSILSDNSSTADGGGIHNSGTLALTNSTLTSNSADANGGGINNFLGTLSVINSTFSNNSAAHGGGIYNYGQLTIMNSTLYNNSASSGGGIHNYASILTTVTNSTFFGNSAGVNGGGIYTYGSNLNITNSTFSGNTSGVYNLGTTLNYANTIIANSLGLDCFSEDTIEINTHNLVEDGSCSASLNGDPSLGELANNGGSTLTMSLLPGSPAIDSGNDTVCAAEPVNNTSQNGVTRPVGAHCDIGSFEYVDTIAPAVSSIVRANVNPTAATSVDFTVTFSEIVSGVGLADFNITTAGLSGAAVSGVSGSGSVYTVSVNTGTGEGTIRLDVPASAVIKDLANNSLNGLPYTSGQTYTISHPAIPRPPALRSPRTNFITKDTTPAFWWASVRNAHSYEIVFARDAAFSFDVASHMVTEPTYEITTATPLSNDDYFWHVRAYNSANQAGAWSAVRSFIIDTSGPSAPQLSFPLDAASSNRTPAFKWLKVSGAVLYEFQYDDDVNFADPLYTVTLRGTSRRPPIMKLGTYYWHVRAKDALGNWGDWSTPFIINITSP